MEENHTSKSKEDLLIKIRELEKEVQKLNNQIIKDDRYGLNWIDVPEGFDQETEDKIPILEEVKDKAIANDDGKPTHILIEGDNYHALTCLNYTHKGKVDVIYIDPPYNTGSDGFTYKDKRFLSEYPNGVLIKKEHPLRHSTWLSFINKRLQLAKELLSERGVIFISIDDNELAQLKLLCDNVKLFGEDNFISIVPRIAKKTSDKGTYFKPTKDYVLVYAKNKNNLEGFGLKKIDDERKYKFEDSKGRYKKNGASLYQPSLDSRPNQRYYIECPDGSFMIPPGNVFPDIIADASFVKPVDNNDKIWRWSYPTYLKNKDKLIFCKSTKSPMINEKGEKASWNIYDKVYLSDLEASTNLPEDVIYDYKNSSATKCLISLGIDFSFSKPFELIRYLIDLTMKNKNIIVLDFFAGSGTTMHATMKLNEEDGGKRQCILVQENESDICEKICYERNKRVMQGYSNQKGEVIDGLGNSMKYYRTTFVGKHSVKNSTDDDRVEFSHKAGYLLALGENTLEEKKKTSYFQIFDSKDKATAIYFKEDLSSFDEFVKEVEEMGKRTAVYIFSWDNAQSFEYNFEHLKEIEIKSIPQAILEIYKSIND